MEDIDIIVEEEAEVVITVDTTTAIVVEVPGVSAASVLTTKGDLLGYSTLPERHPIGADGSILTADSTETRGFKWAEPAPNNIIEDGNSSIEIVDEAAGTITTTIDGNEIMTIQNQTQPITISHEQSLLGDNSPLVSINATGTSAANKGACLWLDSNRGTGAVDIDVFRVDNTDGEIFSIDNAGNTNVKGDILPIDNNSIELGSSSKTISDLHLTDENGTYVTVRELAKLHRNYSENSATTPYTVSHSTSGGVWTITITADGEPDLAFTFNNIVYRSSGTTLSVNATSYAGTDASPNTVYVYVKQSGDDLFLVASNTDPRGVETYYASVAQYKVGTVSTSSTTIYTKVEDVIEMDSIANKVYNRTFIEGPIYIDGMAVTATQSNVTIGAGSYELIFETIDTVSKTVGTDGLFIISNAGSYSTQTNFSFTNYSSGEAISANKYYNVVLGVCQDGTTRIHALVQSGNMVAEYNNLAEAIADGYHTLRTVPRDNLLKNTFIPVARIIIKNDANDYLQQFPNGEYYQDLRTNINIGGGSSGTSSPLTTKGDIYTYDTDNARLPVGTDGYVLTADSNETTGLKWTTVSGASGMSDPMTTRGDMIYRNSSNETARLPVGTADQVLTSDGTDVSWQDASGGTGDKIEEGDSSVEVVDAGTGYIDITADSNLRGRIKSALPRVSFGISPDSPAYNFSTVHAQEQTERARFSCFTCINSNSYDSQFVMARSRGTITTPSALTDDDRIGALNFSGYEGANWKYSAGVFCYVDGTVGTNVIPMRLEFQTSTTTEAGRASRFVVDSNGTCRPGADDTYDLGSSSYRWDDIYATNSTIQTSDRRLKENIVPSELGLDFINSLTPVSYKWIDNTVSGVRRYETIKDGEEVEIEEPYEIENTYTRTHYGMIAQDVMTTISGLGIDSADFAGIIYDEEADRYGLRYNEFMAPLIKAVQELSEANKSLKNDINNLESQQWMLLERIEALEAK